jgi:hypothetical protein
MAQNYETLEEQLKRQGLPLATRMDIIARARRADFIADLIVGATRFTARLVRAAVRRLSARNGTAERLRRA